MASQLSVSPPHRRSGQPEVSSSRGRVGAAHRRATPPAITRPGRGDARPTLLIADDDAVMIVTLCAQLEADFNIIGIAVNSTDAIELAQEHQPDAALIDVDMPGGGARNAVPQIAACSPNCCMVILSGDETHHVVVEFITAGVVAYIRKGVTGSEISQTLNDALSFKAHYQPA